MSTSASQFWKPGASSEDLIRQAQQAFREAYNQAVNVDSLSEVQAIQQAANYCCALFCMAYFQGIHEELQVQRDQLNEISDKFLLAAYK